MASILIGRNVRLEVGILEGAGKAATAITKANPGVVTSATHGFTNGDVIFMDEVVGMEELDQQIARVAAVSGSDFTLEGINTTNFGTFVSGNAIKVGTWATLAKARSIEQGSASANRLDATVLLDTQKQYVFGLSDLPEITIDGLSDIGSAAAQAIINAAKSNATLAFRVTYIGQSAVRLFRGQATLPSETVSVDQLVTSSFSITQTKDRIAYAS